MAITPLTTTIKTGTKVSDSYMIAGFQNENPPFIVKKVFEGSQITQFYRAQGQNSAVSNAFQLEKISQPEAGKPLKEYRTPYLHTYFPPYTGGTGASRCENILLTYMFYDDVPLFYQWLVTDVSGALVTKTSFPDQVSLTVNDQPYTNYVLAWNDGNSLSLYTDKRLPNMKLSIEGVNYTPNSYPVMKWQSGSFTADTPGSAEPHEWRITAGVIYVNISNQAQEWAVGYAEYYDFQQDGFPIVGLDFVDWHTRWRTMISAGSFTHKINGKNNIYDIGSTTISKRVHYGLELTRISNLVYSLPMIARTIIAVYTESGTAVTLTSKDPLSAKVSVSAAQTEDLYADITVTDRFAISEYNSNYHPKYETNYFTVGTAKKDLTTNIYVRPSTDILNETIYTLNASHYTGLGIQDDLTTGGTYSGAQDTTYIINIDATGSPDTFEWSDNGGITYTTGVSVTGGSQALSNGVTATFGATTGHNTNDSWSWVEVNGTDDLIVTTSNEVDKHIDSGNAIQEITDDYILLAQILYPLPRNEVVPIIFRGRNDKLYKLHDFDPREYPVANLEFTDTDTLDIDAMPATRTITIQVPNTILNHASRTEVEQEIRKFIPLGTQLVVNYKS